MFVPVVIVLFIIVWNFTKQLNGQIAFWLLSIKLPKAGLALKFDGWKTNNCSLATGCEK